MLLFPRAYGKMPFNVYPCAGARVGVSALFNANYAVSRLAGGRIRYSNGYLYASFAIGVKIEI